jgi:hypothetical protein
VRPAHRQSRDGVESSAALRIKKRSCPKRE